MVVLRTLTALVWLTNGAAKGFGFRTVDLGLFRAGLIDLPGARSILLSASRTTSIPALHAAGTWIATSAWSVFGPVLTGAELAIGLGLLTGVLARWAAIGGLLLLTPIWVMTWPRGVYLWDYPGDLVPLLVLSIAPGPGIIRLLRSRTREPASSN